MEVTSMRGGKFTSIDDILFLMKNNKVIALQTVLLTIYSVLLLMFWTAAMTFR